MKEHKRYIGGVPVYKPHPESDRYTAGYCPEHSDPIHDKITWNMPRVLTLVGLVVFWLVVITAITYIAC